MNNLIKTAVLGFAAYKAYDYLQDKKNRKKVKKFMNKNMKSINW